MCALSGVANSFLSVSCFLILSYLNIYCLLSIDLLFIYRFFLMSLICYWLIISIILDFILNYCRHFRVSLFNYLIPIVLQISSILLAVSRRLGTVAVYGTRYWNTTPWCFPGCIWFSQPGFCSSAQNLMCKISVHLVFVMLPRVREIFFTQPRFRFVNVFWCGSWVLFDDWLIN